MRRQFRVMPWLVVLVLGTTSPVFGQSRVEKRFRSLVKQAIAVADGQDTPKVLVVARTVAATEVGRDQLKDLARQVRHRVYHALRDSDLVPIVSAEAESLAKDLPTAVPLSDRDIERLKDLSGAQVVLVIDVFERRRHLYLKLVLDEGEDAGEGGKDWQRQLRLPEEKKSRRPGGQRTITAGLQPAKCAPKGT